MNSSISLSSQNIGRQFDGGLGARRPGKVLIATSGASQCASVSVFLARRGHAFVIAETREDALAHLKSGSIDLVVAAMPGPDADAELMRLVRQVAPGLPVILLALGAGELDGTQLDCATGLTRAVAGEAPEAQARLASLTTRERQVLNLIVGGRANKMIAYELSISPRTVENHRARVMEKLKVKSVAELVRLALGAKALEVVAKHRDIALLVTDVVLAGSMNGRRLAQEVGNRQPGIKVLYMSGYTQDAIVSQGRLDPGVHFIQKPFRKADLAAKAREALAAGAPLSSS